MDKVIEFVKTAGKTWEKQAAEHIAVVADPARTTEARQLIDDYYDIAEKLGEILEFACFYMEKFGEDEAGIENIERIMSADDDDDAISFK